MKKNIFSLFGYLGCLSQISMAGTGLYLPTITKDSLPLRFSTGMDMVWDDNASPGGLTDGDESYSLNPYVGVLYNKLTEQTAVNAFGRFGGVYYLEELESTGSKDFYSQSSAGLSIDHRFDGRASYRSFNDVALQLEPDYSYGIASVRQPGESLFLSTDHAIGYRWTSLFGTYTGVKYRISETLDSDNTRRDVFEVYNQFRYQLDPVSVFTSDYRYSVTDADYSTNDIINHYILIGLERRFSFTTLLVTSIGAQMREIDGGGSDTTSPYVEFALRSNVNTKFMFNSFLRYGLEDTDNTVQVPAPAVYEEKTTLRLGVNTSYYLSPKVSLLNGVEIVASSNEEGRLISNNSSIADGDEFVFNANIGLAVELTEYLTGKVMYNYTTSDSDLQLRSYDRNRVTIGLDAQF